MVGLIVSAIAYLPAYIVSRHRLGLEPPPSVNNSSCSSGNTPGLLRNIDRPGRRIGCTSAELAYTVVTDFVSLSPTGTLERKGPSSAWCSAAA